MNHAVFCVTVKAFPKRCELYPLVAAVNNQTAGNHLSSPSGESSKILPTLTENCFRHFLQRQIARVLMNHISLLPQPKRGQVTPSGHRASAKNCRQISGSAK